MQLIEFHFLSRLVMMAIVMYLFVRGRKPTWQEGIFWIGVWVVASAFLYITLEHKEFCI